MKTYYLYCLLIVGLAMSIFGLLDNYMVEVAFGAGILFAFIVIALTQCKYIKEPDHE